MGTYRSGRGTGQGGLTTRPWRNFYGRRHGKKLRPAQVRLLEEVLPTLVIPGVAPEENPARVPLGRGDVFAEDRPLWLEIGFGGGEHLVHQAAAHPEVGLIGCEPFINGVAMALGKIEKAGSQNLRLYAGDARDLIEVLPEALLERVFLLYPDPWPKARHYRRRFANPENLAMLHRAMAPGAELRLATDIAAYAEHAREAVAAAPGFAMVPGPAPDWSAPWPDWPGTRYEVKALAAGRRPYYLTIRRE